GELAQGARDPARHRHPAGSRHHESQDAEAERDASFRVDLLGVVVLRDDDLDEPGQTAHRHRDGPAEIPRSLVLEFERGLLLHGGASEGRAGQLGIDDLGPRRPRAATADQDGPLAGRNEDPPVLGNAQVFQRAGQSVEQEVDREHAPNVALGIEQRRRARDAETSAGVELVGLRPHQVTLRHRGLEVRALRGPVAVVVHSADRLTRPVGEDSILLQSDPRADWLRDPGETDNDGTGEPGEQDDEPDERKRERRTAARTTGGSYRSSSPRYSLTRLASAASGLRARYLSKAARAWAGSFCW